MAEILMTYAKAIMFDDAAKVLSVWPEYKKGL